jgi:capsular exopolysaccharide synthesis family protein
MIAMKMERDVPDRVEIFKEAATPANPDEAIPFKKVGMAGLLAFAAPFGLAVAFEGLYRRVGSRDQLETVGAMRVVGEVPLLPRRIRQAGHRGAAKANRELQLFEESIDGLRTYLAVVDSLNGLSVLAVNSAVSGEGKTSLASQLAVSVASATGQPTLLIDGDMRSPDIHRIFDVENSPGLAELLKGEVACEDAIETGFSDTLHLLTAGHLSTSPHRLLSNGEFSQLIDQLRKQYRYIIVDTPPILPASESLLISRAADAAVLCVRRDFSRLAQVTEACQRLQAAGVKTAGAVLNGIPASMYSHRYGSYYYNRDRSPVTMR